MFNRKKTKEPLFQSKREELLKGIILGIVSIGLIMIAAIQLFVIISFGEDSE